MHPTAEVHLGRAFEINAHVIKEMLKSQDLFGQEWHWLPCAYLTSVCPWRNICSSRMPLYSWAVCFLAFYFSSLTS